MYYPFSMFMRVHNPGGRVKKLMFALAGVTLLASVIAFVGSIYALATAL
jgi:hypothetical protein